MNFSVIMIINILSLNVNPISKVLHVSNLWQIFKSRLTLNCKPRTCDHRRLCPAHCSRQTVSRPVPRLTLLSFLDVFTHVSRSQTSTKCFMDSEVFPTPNFCLCHPNSLISCINIKQLFICHYQKIFVQHKSDQVLPLSNAFNSSLASGIESNFLSMILNPAYLPKFISRNLSLCVLSSSHFKQMIN